LKHYSGIYLLATLSVVVLSQAKCLAEPQPLSRAHAHNDYEHARPLLDALSHGFCSVEADVYLVDGRLLVAHDRSKVKRERTLESLYLDPLRSRTQQNGGRALKHGPVFWLLIDVKSDGESTYRALHTLLAKYDDVVASVSDGQVTDKAVRVVISGNRAKEAIEADVPRYAGIDGRISDLESEQSSLLLPWISDNWGRHFRWRGTGPFPVEEREKLESLVKSTHQSGRMLRLWATPDVVEVWSVLHQAGVDLINTDDLAGLQKFLQSRDRAAKPRR
jgi:hypothetical protein